MIGKLCFKVVVFVNKMIAFMFVLILAFTRWVKNKYGLMYIEQYSHLIKATYGFCCVPRSKWKSCWTAWLQEVKQLKEVETIFIIYNYLQSMPRAVTY